MEQNFLFIHKNYDHVFTIKTDVVDTKLFQDIMNTNLQNIINANSITGPYKVVNLHNGAEQEFNSNQTHSGGNLSSPENVDSSNKSYNGIYPSITVFGIDKPLVNKSTIDNLNSDKIKNKLSPRKLNELKKHPLKEKTLDVSLISKRIPEGIPSVAENVPRLGKSSRSNNEHSNPPDMKKNMIDDKPVIPLIKHNFIEKQTPRDNKLKINPVSPTESILDIIATPKNSHPISNMETITEQLKYNPLFEKTVPTNNIQTINKVVNVGNIPDVALNKTTLQISNLDTPNTSNFLHDNRSNKENKILNLSKYNMDNGVYCPIQ